MIFRDNEHKEFYEAHKNIYTKTSELDYNLAALIYTLGIDVDCRKHYKSLYSEDEKIVCGLENLGEWVTASSLAIIRLAFDMFHDDPVVLTDNKDKQVDMFRKYSTANVFGTLAYHGLAQYGVQALKLRYGFE